MEPLTGIEPVQLVYETNVLPLYYRGTLTMTGFMPAPEIYQFSVLPLNYIVEMVRNEGFEPISVVFTARDAKPITPTPD